MSDKFEYYLDKYAEVVIKIGVNIQPGQRLYIRAPVESADFTRRLTRQAYLAGAKYVYVLWLDDHIKHIRLKHGSEESLLEYPDWEIESRVAYMKNGDAWLLVYNEDPDLMADVDPARLKTVQKIGSEKFKPIVELRNNGQYTNGSIVSGALPGWANKVFPDLPTEQAMAKLWDVIFDICRVKTDDPVAEWERLRAKLKARLDYLQEKRYATLHYRAPGTDLRVGLPEEHVWVGGGDVYGGVFCMPNFPTDEVFTLPHKDRIDGVVASTKPLVQNGVMVDDFSLTFEGGRITNVSARMGEEQLRNLIDMDEGARSLGEVALVPNSAPIAQVGLLFYNGLYDENASCHMALGRAYRMTMRGGEEMSSEEFAQAGGNNSNIHVDFMMGSDEMNIDGITDNGDVEPVMRAGEWAFDV